MATMKSLGCKTCFVPYACLFLMRPRTGNESTERMFTYRLGLLCLTDSNSTFTGYHYLVLQDWYRLKLHVSIKRTSVRWRALCVVCSCVMHCTVAVWLLLVSRALFLLSLAPGLRISIVLFFSKHCLAKMGQCRLSLIWLSVVFDLLPLLLLCL